MKPLNIALIGYGRMGKAIEEVAIERGHAIVVRATSSQPATADSLRQADVALDFSRPDVVSQTLTLCATAGTPLVLGTTGWNDQTTSLQIAADKIGIVVSANFSLGIAVMVRLAGLLSQLLSPQLGYQFHVHEVHHRAKRDAPSGTALLLAQTLAEHSAIERAILTEVTVPAPADAITVSSARVGKIVGMHSVIADSDADTIELSHTAKSRRGFALGAVLAAEWIVGRRGLYHFVDIAFEVIAAAQQ